MPGSIFFKGKGRRGWGLTSKSLPKGVKSQRQTSVTLSYEFSKILEKKRGGGLKLLCPYQFRSTNEFNVTYYVLNP